MFIISDIVESAGGEWLKSVPKKENAGVFVISCAQDKKVLSGAIKANVNIQDKEILLTGLLKGDLDFKKHKLKL